MAVIAETLVEDKPAEEASALGRFIGPVLFTALDGNKDSSLTRAEMKETFEKWASEWDADKSGAITEEQLRNGLSAAMPRPDFNGVGRGPGGPGGGRGPK